CEPPAASAHASVRVAPSTHPIRAAPPLRRPRLVIRLWRSHLADTLKGGVLMSIASPSFAALAAVLCLQGAALAADAPPAADVLTKLHESNLKEIEMGKIAQKNGQSKEVKS